jgi:hypothetical protein
MRMFENRTERHENPGTISIDPDVGVALGWFKWYVSSNEDCYRGHICNAANLTNLSRCSNARK